MLGIGMDFLRKLPVGDDYTVDVGAMRKAIEDDRDAGLRPLAVVGTAGTVATGAVDPLYELADLAEEHGLWFHVDAAYGGGAALVAVAVGEADLVERRGPGELLGVNPNTLRHRMKKLGIPFGRQQPSV